ncbi:MAG: ornithine cyclodeaminase family protein, partial [Candidatus Aminicenantes bacterium]|nr:ornithine cyclodeaminase family protein [Candidatus Aminicenantes bacterium]
PGRATGGNRLGLNAVMGVKMLCISEKEILEVVNLKDIMTAVKNAMLLYERKEFKMPKRMHADYRGNTLLLMPCFTKEKFATKLVSLFPGNAEQDLPVLMGTVILNDGQTGRPLALMNGAKLTALRTGAVGGMAVYSLTPPGIKTVGIVGAGVQGFHQALFACRVRGISRVFVYDALPQRVDHVMQELADFLMGVKIYRAFSVEDLVRESELIITATNAEQPVLPDDTELLRGKHFIGIGSYKPEMREFPAALFKLVDEMYVDTFHAKEESGDLIDPLRNGWIEERQVRTLGQLMLSQEKQAPVPGRTTLFKSVGMALFDLLVADMVYRGAVKKGVGTQVEL